MSRPPADHEPEPSFGADEEGEAPVDEDAATHDRAAWVHSKKRKPEDGAGSNKQSSPLAGEDGGACPGEGRG